MHSGTHTISYYRQLEQQVFPNIKGMSELTDPDPAIRERAAAEYPDAVFALQVADNLLCGIREISQINQKAYLAILRGENVSAVRHRHGRELDAYFKRHSWDD